MAEERALCLWASRLLSASGINVTQFRHFSNGIAIIRLVEALSGAQIDPKLYNPHPRSDRDKLANINCVLDFVKSKGIRVSIASGRDLFAAKADPFLTLLTELFFKSQAPGNASRGRADLLLRWADSHMRPRGISIKDWQASWADGLAVYTLVAVVLPSGLDLATGRHYSPDGRVEKALEACSTLCIPVYAVRGDFSLPRPNATLIKMQVQEIFNAAPAIHQALAPETLTIPVGKHRSSTPPPLPRAEKHLPPECRSAYSLGIDIGSSQVRYSVYARGKPASAFAVKYLSSCVSVTPDGRIIPGMSRDPNAIEVPSTTHLLGRQFNDPAIRSALKEFPLPVYEHPVSHTCVIDAGGTPVTPEDMMAAILNGVREEASRSVDGPVVDTSIAVPTLFTSAQRAALRDAAESVDLRIAHVASGTLVAARAMKLQGHLVESGPSLIVDVGASKTEVSLIQNNSAGIREVKTVGSHSIGTNAIRDRLVNTIMEEVHSNDPILRIRLQKAVQDAIEDARDRRVLINDLGLNRVISDREFDCACEPVANRMRELLRDVLPLQDGTSIKHVGCTGGGTKIPQFRKITELACPSAKQHQLDPGQITVSGATLDAALQTNRLNRIPEMSVTAVVPHSIGMNLLGGVIDHVIRRGETLPAIGEGIQCTTKDGQTSLPFGLYQGEHYLTELGDLIGTSELTGVTSLPRGQCEVVCRIEYDNNGILQFSAREAKTGKSVSATFTAKTEFTEADRSRLHSGSEADLLAEARLASLRYVRRQFELDVERAAEQKGTEEFSAATEKWRKWIDSHTDGEIYMFLQTRYQMQNEFQRLNPKDWVIIDKLTPDLQFQTIYPTGPSFVNEGCAILRFLSAPECPKVALYTMVIATNEIYREADVCQFSVSGKIETVARICFPANGRYKVTAFIGTVDQTNLHQAKELSYTQYAWRIDVSGVPAAKRSLCQLIPGRPFMPLKCPDKFRIEPSDSCVRIPETVYMFTCTFLGTILEINGREAQGEKEQTFFATKRALPEREGWKSQECTLKCPREGVWRVFCWVDDLQVCSQTVMAGSISYLSLTDEEKLAFNAPYPQGFSSGLY